MHLEELKEVIRECFANDPEVEGISGLSYAMAEAGYPMPDSEDVRMACDALVREGVLQRAGREGYEATVTFMVEHNHEVPE